MATQHMFACDRCDVCVERGVVAARLKSGFYILRADCAKFLRYKNHLKTTLKTTLKSTTLKLKVKAFYFKVILIKF